MLIPFYFSICNSDQKHLLIVLASLCSTLCWTQIKVGFLYQIYLEKSTLEPRQEEGCVWASPNTVIDNSKCHGNGTVIKLQQESRERKISRVSFDQRLLKGHRIWPGIWKNLDWCFIGIGSKGIAGGKVEVESYRVWYSDV